MRLDLLFLMSSVSRRKRGGTPCIRRFALSPSFRRLSRPLVRTRVASHGLWLDLAHLSVISTRDRWWAWLPGTGNPIKQWGVERFSRVARALNKEAGCRFILIGGEADRADAALLAAALPSDQCVNAVGKLDISDVPLALATVDVFIGNDTGTTHMAALMGIPTINIFSGVVDINVWHARGPNVVTLYAPVPCAPCRLGSARDCSYGRVCLTSISEDDVVRNALSLLQHSTMQNANQKISIAAPEERVAPDEFDHPEANSPGIDWYRSVRV